MSRTAGGWWQFAEWAFAFGLLSLAVIGAWSIGMLLLPFAVVALVLAARRSRAWPEAPTGGLAGAGVTLLIIAFMHRNDVPCRPEDQTMILHRGESFSCGGFNPRPWFNTGAALTVAGLGLYAGWLRTRRRDAAVAAPAS